MNIFGVVARYLKIKAMSPAERKKLAPHVTIFAGKAAPGYYDAKLCIRAFHPSAAHQARRPVSDRSTRFSRRAHQRRLQDGQQRPRCRRPAQVWYVAPRQRERHRNVS
jgi:hypothetical protein